MKVVDFISLSDHYYEFNNRKPKTIKEYQSFSRIHREFKTYIWCDPGKLVEWRLKLNPNIKIYIEEIDYYTFLKEIKEERLKEQI